MSATVMAPMSYGAALPELVLAASVLGLLLFGVLRERQAATFVTAGAVLTLLVAAAVTMTMAGGPRSGLGGHLVFDGYAAFLKVLIYLGAAAGLVSAEGYLRDRGLRRIEFPILVLTASLGMGLMVAAGSLLTLYMSLELQSLSLYVLAAFDRDRLRPSEAGLKFFILGALASGMLLYGASLLYGFTGTIMFAELATRLAPPAGSAGPNPLSLGAVVGMVFVLAGLAFKMAAVPFHMWTPDVYEGAPTPVTAFFAAAPKLAAMGLTLRLLVQPLGDHVAEWQQVIVVIALGSMLLGAFAAIGQTNVKRLLAYSGIGQIGYALTGLAAGNAAGVEAVLAYLAIYLPSVAGTFAVILMMRQGGEYREEINAFAGLSRTRPFAAACMAVMMFSLAGIPPLAGFFGKLYVFGAAVGADLVPLAVVGLLTSVVAAYYYLRLVKLMYFDPPVGVLDPVPHGGLVAIAGTSAAAMLAFALLAGPLAAATRRAAAAVIG